MSRDSQTRFAHLVFLANFFILLDKHVCAERFGHRSKRRQLSERHSFLPLRNRLSSVDEHWHPRLPSQQRLGLALFSLFVGAGALRTVEFFAATEPDAP